MCSGRLPNSAPQLAVVAQLLQRVGPPQPAGQLPLLAGLPDFVLPYGDGDDGFGSSGGRVLPSMVLAAAQNGIRPHGDAEQQPPQQQPPPQHSQDSRHDPSCQRPAAAQPCSPPPSPVLLPQPPPLQLLPEAATPVITADARAEAQLQAQLQRRFAAADAVAAKAVTQAVRQRRLAMSATAARHTMLHQVGWLDATMSRPVML